MTVAAAPLVAVGEVLKPHGLTGEVKVRSLSDRTEDRFRRLRECILWEPRTDRREACRIASCRVEGEQTVLVRIEGIDSPEAARRLSGQMLAVDRADVLPPRDGSFYSWQLEGARVETRDGREAGTFVRVEPGGAQDLWVIAHEGRERLIPAVAEIVIDVSVADRRIVIDPPEGLLDL
jgi:16S rRNA processing protein RimM